MGKELCHPQEGGGELSQNPTQLAAEPATKCRSLVLRPSASSASTFSFVLFFALVLVARTHLMQSSSHVSAGLTDMIY